MNKTLDIESAKKSYVKLKLPIYLFIFQFKKEIKIKLVDYL